uniref:CSON004926 protein n=1 Tax=Culicoides sonorensis TaxID=179676 RepID=A0A336LUT6_CULSO
MIISWFRKKDKTLLTVGLSTYSSDDRFFVEHTRHLGNWALRIKNAREDDEGLYECQISSHPPQSIFIELRIVEAVAEIIEAPDLHINEGYHEDRMVNYDVDDGITVSNTKLSSSVLTVRNATARHGGNYTCAPANARQASIYVHVLKGEKPAAMQHPDKTTSAATSSSSTLSAIHYILLPTISTAIYSGATSRKVPKCHCMGQIFASIELTNEDFDEIQFFVVGEYLNFISFVIYFSFFHPL